ncbi:hypothetical protein [Streptomyces sp. XM4193]|uniref:hypothetical protein n=1 Tax=Streptomyces sp. XM4193 TaxID=2929782 RepID=UPI0027E38A8F|nr:hypothetical protein [Streptomyces sp. XM4193]
MDTETRITTWRSILADPQKSWVLYENGTCVVLPSPGGDPGAEATAVLREFGPVHPGSPAGDFGVIGVRDADGWVVTGRHPDVLTHVATTEVPANVPESDFAVGLCGRAKRDQDAVELRIVHVEDGRLHSSREAEEEAGEVGEAADPEAEGGGIPGAGGARSRGGPGGSGGSDAD